MRKHALFVMVALLLFLVACASPQPAGTNAYQDSSGNLLFGTAANYAQISGDGTFSLAGTARVTRDSWLAFSGLQAPGTKPATYTDLGLSGVWEFTDGTDDTVVGNIKLLNDMDKTVAPQICLGWSSPTADPGDNSKQAVWQLEYVYSQIGEDTTAAAQGTVEVTTSASTQTDGLVLSTFPTLDVPNAADVCVHVRIKRLGVDGDDDVGDVTHLHGMVMLYTSDKLGMDQ